MFLSSETCLSKYKRKCKISFCGDKIWTFSLITRQICLKLKNDMSKNCTPNGPNDSLHDYEIESEWNGYGHQNIKGYCNH